MMPYLKIGWSVGATNGRQHQTLHLTNDGLGPAKIERVSIIREDKAIDTDPYKYLTIHYDSLPDVLKMNLVLPGRLIPSNERIIMLRVRNDQQQHVIIRNFKFPKSMMSLLDGTIKADAVIEIEYSSVYGDKWVIRSNEEVPQEI